MVCSLLSLRYIDKDYSINKLKYTFDIHFFSFFEKIQLKKSGSANALVHES